jgi:hypothetical protein
MFLEVYFSIFNMIFIVFIVLKVHYACQRKEGKNVGEEWNPNREEGNEIKPKEVKNMPEDRGEADKGDAEKGSKLPLKFYKKGGIVPIYVDEKLDAFFEDNPLFYDITDESYKNLPLRNAKLQSFGLREGLHREYFSFFYILFCLFENYIKIFCNIVIIIQIISIFMC